MKLALLTQPLHTNYGGILQAYALQRVLNDMGHQTWLIHFCKMEDYRTRRWKKERFVRVLKNVARFVLGRKRQYPLSAASQAFVEKHTREFIRKYITPISPLIESPSSLASYCGSERFDGYVVGSDQVWRPLYSPQIEDFFLDFCSGGKEKRIAYAASFGTDQWEFSEEQTLLCRANVQEFDAVSVREDSGIALCQQHFGVKAVQTIDPTMLLDRDDYEWLVKQDQCPRSQGNLFCYLLDRNGRKRSLVNEVAQQCGLIPFFTQSKADFTQENMEKSPEDCVSPSVTAWIRSFMDAEFVLTDSFHGCVFSILFHKPFVAVGNKTRGETRFQSLLRRLGLEERLCDNMAKVIMMMDQPIDWDDVERRRSQWREESLQFLKKNLS